MLDLTLADPVLIPSAGLLADDHALLARCEVGAHDADHAVAEATLDALLAAAATTLRGPSPGDAFVAAAVAILGRWPERPLGLDLVAVVARPNLAMAWVSGSGGVLHDAVPRTIHLAPSTLRYARPDLGLTDDDWQCDVVVDRLSHADDATDAQRAVRRLSIGAEPLVATVDPSAFEALRGDGDPAASTSLCYRPEPTPVGRSPERWIRLPERRARR